MEIDQFLNEIACVHPSDYVELAHKQAHSFEDDERRMLVHDFISCLVEGYMKPLVDGIVEEEKVYMAAVYTAELFLAAFHQLYSSAEEHMDNVQVLNELLKV